MWSQRELWGIHESVRNDHKLLVDSHAWATLSAALHDAAANGTLLGGGFMDEGSRLHIHAPRQIIYTTKLAVRSSLWEDQ